MIANQIPLDKIAFALCRVGDKENEIADAREYIKRAGYKTLSGSLPEKAGFRRASDEGKALSEVSFRTLRSRAEELAQSIIDESCLRLDLAKEKVESW